MHACNFIILKSFYTFFLSSRVIFPHPLLVTLDMEPAMDQAEPSQPSSTPRTSVSSTSSSSLSKNPPPAPPPKTPSLSLLEPANSTKKKNRTRVFRVFRNVFRSFPIITPACRLPSLPGGQLPESNSRIIAGSRITGTLFGYRKGRVSLSIQESSRTLPTVVVELALLTNVLQKEMNLGMVRIALECEKRDKKEKIDLLEEPLWTMYCNGKKNGYGVKREATEEDLNVMEILKPVSMGAGVLPGKSDVEGPDGEMTYMRAHFERVVKSKDAETLYMLSPDANDGPELSIFFVRI
ncbi:protein MIZU-KUSSEI 1 [Capsicum chacoense]